MFISKVTSSVDYDLSTELPRFLCKQWYLLVKCFIMKSILLCSCFTALCRAFSLYDLLVVCCCILSWICQFQFFYSFVMYPGKIKIRAGELVNVFVDCFFLLGFFYRWWCFKRVLWLCSDNFVFPYLYLYSAFLIVFYFEGKQIDECRSWVLWYVPLELSLICFHHTWYKCN